MVFQAKKFRVILIATAAFSAACGSENTVTDPDVTLGPVPETWVAEAGARFSVGTSSSTIVLPDGTFRLYLPLGDTFKSTDGLVWASRSVVVLPETMYNPAVVRMSNGTYVMIYESNRALELPAGARFYRATSTDGINFTKTLGSGTNGAVMMPGSGSNAFVSVPDIAVLPDGRWRIYFVGGDGYQIETAVSTDLGLSWTKEGLVAIAGMSSGRAQVDPDILVLSNGSLRLYFAASPTGKDLNNHSIYSATSTDGRNFLLDSGVRIGVANTSVGNADPDVVVLPNGKLRMYYGYRASSTALFELHSAITQ